MARTKGAKGKKTLLKEERREAFAQLVMQAMAPLIRGQLAQAAGLHYLVTRDKKTGKFIRVGRAMAGKLTEETVEIWQKEPSIEAFKYLMDRALDKPAEQKLQVEVTDLTAQEQALDRGRARVAAALCSTKQKPQNP